MILHTYVLNVVLIQVNYLLYLNTKFLGYQEKKT